MARSVTCDTDIGGVRMSAGDRVLLSFSAACRDPRVCEDQEDVKLDRERTYYVAFGIGVRRCIGERLARLVLRYIRCERFEIAHGEPLIRRLQADPAWLTERWDTGHSPHITGPARVVAAIATFSW